MRGARQLAGRVDAQGFALDAAQALAQQGAVVVVVEQGQAAVELVRHSVSFLVLLFPLEQRLTENRTARSGVPHSPHGGARKDLRAGGGALWPGASKSGDGPGS